MLNLGNGSAVQLQKGREKKDIFRVASSVTHSPPGPKSRADTGKEKEFPRTLVLRALQVLQKYVRE
jgi:hypothetical protein